MNFLALTNYLEGRASVVKGAYSMGANWAQPRKKRPGLLYRSTTALPNPIQFQTLQTRKGISSTSNYTTLRENGLLVLRTRVLSLYSCIIFVEKIIALSLKFASQSSVFFFFLAVRRTLVGRRFEINYFVRLTTAKISRGRYMKLQNSSPPPPQQL